MTKQKILQQLIVKEVVKSEMLNIAGEMFIQNEKVLDKSNQIIKCFEKYVGDENIKNDILNMVFEKKTMNI